MFKVVWKGSGNQPFTPALLTEGDTLRDAPDLMRNGRRSHTLLGTWTGHLVSRMNTRAQECRGEGSWGRGRGQERRGCPGTSMSEQLLLRGCGGPAGAHRLGRPPGEAASHLPATSRKHSGTRREAIEGTLTTRRPQLLLALLAPRPPQVGLASTPQPQPSPEQPAECPAHLATCHNPSTRWGLDTCSPASQNILSLQTIRLLGIGFASNWRQPPSLCTGHCPGGPRPTGPPRDAAHIQRQSAAPRDPDLTAPIQARSESPET